MNALLELEQAGYRFSLNGEGVIRYIYHSEEPLDDAWVRPLLAELREKRQEVAAILSARAPFPADSEGFTDRTRRHIVFPADTPLPFPAGSWQRLDDGRIEALLNFAELKEIRRWRDEILP